MVFLITSLIFFVDQIMTNFLELSFITTEDFGNNKNSQRDQQLFYQQAQEFLNVTVTSITIITLIGVFVVGIFIQVINQIRFNRHFYGSVFSNTKQKIVAKNPGIEAEDQPEIDWKELKNADADQSYDEAVERLGGKASRIFELSNNQ